MSSDNVEIWGQWSKKHSLSDQLKRQSSASTAKLTPISVDNDLCSATFKGSSGRYIATLSSCECTDFRRRKLPCKHMYRLAHELGVFQLPEPVIYSETPPVCSDEPLMNADEALKLVQSILSEEEQMLFLRFCWECGNDNAGESLLDGAFADKLIAANLTQLVTDPNILLKYLHWNLIKKLLPNGTKSPRTKADLIAIVAPLVTCKDISYPNDKKCVTLHSSIAHLGHRLHRRLCKLYPSQPDEYWG
ncbi:SWIM zinc finger family protein [Enterocloster citroniae]